LNSKGDIEMPKITIRREHISEPQPGTVAFHNPVLRNLLVQKQPAALDWLSARVAPVDVSKISIDDQGRVVVADKAFAEVIANKLKAPQEAAAGDTACSNGAC
jgi:hypothetical protein